MHIETTTSKKSSASHSAYGHQQTGDGDVTDRKREEYRSNRENDMRNPLSYGGERFLFVWIFLICLASYFGSGQLYTSTLAPEYSLETTLQMKLQNSEIQMFNELARLGLGHQADVRSILEDQRRAVAFRAQAKKAWDSIRVGEVIAKGHSTSGLNPIGKNVEVQRLHKEADSLEESVARHKRHFAVREGQALLDTASSSLWRERQDIMRSLEQLHDSHAWYYRYGWGTALSVINAVSLPLAGLSGVLSMLTFVLALIGLFRKS